MIMYAWGKGGGGYIGVILVGPPTAAGPAWGLD